jgi:hypothetical protein
VSAAVTLPAFNDTVDLPAVDVDVAATWTGDKVRAKIVAELKHQAALGLKAAGGETVPEDRIAVTLI